MDEALTRIAPKKEPKRRIQIPIRTVHADEDLYVLSFDGSARVVRGGGAYSAILWRLPGWEVVRARSTYAEGLTVNEAEYNGLLLGLDLLKGQDPKRLMICGDSNLVIRQVRGEIDCKAPALTLLRQKVMIHLRGWLNHELVHVKRDWNASADSLASAALRNQCGVKVEREAEHQDLVTLNRLDEVVVVGPGKRTVQVMTVTRSRGRIGSSPQILEETFVKGIRIEWILKAQNEEAWILGLKKYLMGDVRDLSREDTKSYSIIATDYAVDLNDLLFYCPPTKRVNEDRDGLMRLK
ncbi:hypothetical protein PInf_002581 [Phytophthora infestans]|nr:hypothetical protein PInf_002581 [Phytophthora infestans]